MYDEESARAKATRRWLPYVSLLRDLVKQHCQCGRSEVEPGDGHMRDAGACARA